MYFFTSETACSAFSTDRAVRTIDAPPMASRFADSRPKPELPPVITIVCPSKLPGVGVKTLVSPIRDASGHVEACCSAFRRDEARRRVWGGNAMASTKSKDKRRMLNLIVLRLALSNLTQMDRLSRTFLLVLKRDDPPLR